MIKKIIFYVLSIVIIIFGVFCSIGLYKDLKAENYTNGSLELVNTYGQDSFTYASNNLVFEIDENSKFFCEKNLIRVNDFDGEKKKYNIVFNDYLIIDSIISSGAIHFTFVGEFISPEGDANLRGSIDISIRFLSDKTNLIISTNTRAEADYFMDYFKNFGFILNVYEII